MKVNYQEVAKAFLKAASLAEKIADTGEYNPAIRFWREEFFVYKNGKYELISDSELDTLINRWLASHEDRDLNDMIGSKAFLQRTKHGIRTFSTVPDLIEWPALWVDDDKYQNATSVIAFKNGLLNIPDYLEAKASGRELSKSLLFPLSANFLSFNVLPFDFDPQAKCPTYDSVLHEIMDGNEDLKKTWHEWLGCHFNFEENFEKFLILTGEGGNGKSVLLTILRELIGKGNYSSLSLANFCASQQFALITTLGKMANICSELGDFEKVSENTLKAFISQEPVTCNRKGKSYLTFKPFAKLTFACNSLPHLNDKTDGAWRRMILIELTRQFLDESKQRKELKEESFWHGSGELSGIMNYALEGLIAARVRNGLYEGAQTKEGKALYRKESNPIELFIDEKLEISMGASTPMQALYACYEETCRKYGYRPRAFLGFCKDFHSTCRRNKLPIELEKGRKRNAALNVALAVDDSPMPTFGGYQKTFRGGEN